MRIVLILDDAFPWDDLPADLEHLGHEVRVLKIGTSPTLRERGALSLLFRDACSYDVIHNLTGVAALLYAGLTPTPVVTTLFSPPGKDEREICAQAQSNWFFLDAAGALLSPGLNGIETTEQLRHASAGFYEAVYEQVIKACAKKERRPWGFFEVLADDSSGHKVKRITLWPGKRLSLQYHTRRQEHWTVVSGKARVTLNQEIFDLIAAESIDIARGAHHRIENIGKDLVVIIEVQLGEYFGEDDIVRIEDDFGRQ